MATQLNRMIFIPPVPTFTLVLLGLLSFSPETGAINLRGVGASFPNEVYQAWIPSYKAHRQANVNLNMSYTSVGSGNGKRAIVHNPWDVEYAGSDSVLKTSERNSKTDLVMFPTMAGGAVLAYNLPHCDYTLNLTREHVVGIFNGTFSMWNASSLQTSNPSCQMPDKPLLVIARRDKSGTTSMFTEALSSFSSAWAAEYGVFSAGVVEDTDSPVSWNQSVIHMFGEGNNGMSGLVKSIRYTIGYMVVNAAQLANLPYARIQNKAGVYTLPTSKAVQAAMDSHAGGNLTVSLADGDLTDAYPIASFTYLIMYKTTMLNCLSAKELVRYVKWFMEDPYPRQDTEDKLMVPLSNTIVEKIRKEVLMTVTCNGNNMWNAVLEEIAQENEKEEPWLLAVYISVPLFCVVLMAMLTYILWQRYKLFKMIDSDEWNIPIEDILFFEDKQQMSVGRSRLQCAMSVKSFVSVAEIPDGEEMLSQILQWPGKWKSNVVGVRLMEVKQLREVNRALKKAMLELRDTLIHANVVRFFGLTELESERYVIEEYCAKGSMVDILQNNKYNLNNDFKYSLAADIVSGMAFLHGNNIVHGSLTSTCCIIDARWTVKIGDWEYCHLVTTLFPKKSPLLMLMHVADEDKSSHAASFRDFWVAPEIIKAEFMEPPAFSADVYSFAIILHEIYTREDPYAELADTLTPQQVVRAVCSNHLRPQHTEDIPVRMRQITEIAWSDNPTFRPSFDQISKMLRQNRTSRKSVLDSMMEAMEEYTGHLEEQVAERSAEVALAKQNLENFLADCVPQHLVQRLANGEAAKLAAGGDSNVQGRVYANLGLVVFDVLHVHEALMHAPSRDVLVFLNDLCAGVDGIVTRCGAYRAAVQGDSQTILVGLESETTFLDQRCATVAHLAFDLAHFISNMAPIKSGSHPTSLSVRAGVHVGKVVTGMVGGAAPRFVALGEGVEVTRALVWCSDPGKVRVSRNVFSHLEKNLDFVSEEAGWIVCAGMEMESFWISLRIPKKTESVPSDHSVDSGVEVEKSRPNSRGPEDNADDEHGPADVTVEINVPAAPQPRRLFPATADSNSSNNNGGANGGGGEIYQRFLQPGFPQFQSQQRQPYRHQLQTSHQVLSDISEEDERQNSPLFFQHHHHQQQQQQQLQQPTYRELHQQEQQQQQQQQQQQHAVSHQVHPVLRAFDQNQPVVSPHYFQHPDHFRHAGSASGLPGSEASHFIPAVTVMDSHLALPGSLHEEMGRGGGGGLPFPHHHYHHPHHQHHHYQQYLHPHHQQDGSRHFIPLTILRGRTDMPAAGDQSGYTDIPVSTHTGRTGMPPRTPQPSFVHQPPQSHGSPGIARHHPDSAHFAHQESDRLQGRLAPREVHELRDLSGQGGFDEALSTLSYQETSFPTPASNFQCRQSLGLSGGAATATGPEAGEKQRQQQGKEEEEQQQQQQQNEHEQQHQQEQQHQKEQQQHQKEQQQHQKEEEHQKEQQRQKEQQQQQHEHQQQQQQQPSTTLSPGRSRYHVTNTSFSSPPPAPCLLSPLSLNSPGNQGNQTSPSQQQQELEEGRVPSLSAEADGSSQQPAESVHIESMPNGLQIRRVKRSRQNSSAGRGGSSSRKGSSKKANKIYPGRLY